MSRLEPGTYEAQTRALMIELCPPPEWQNNRHRQRLREAAVKQTMLQWNGMVSRRSGFQCLYDRLRLRLPCDAS